MIQRALVAMSESGGAVTSLAAELINCASVCPEDGGAQTLLAKRLETAGFAVERLEVDGISNLLAIYGSVGPLVGFSCHSDVVPAGDPQAWTTPPFEAAVREGALYGRGAIDMKGPMAASIVAAERFVASHAAETLPFRLAFLIAGDEEVMRNHGTKDLLARLKERGDHLTYCVVTESTSHAVLGDMVKVGRRGSLVGRMKLRGTQGHSAYPHLASNPIHHVLAPLDALAKREWGNGHEGFPPTSFVVTNINAGTGAANVIPGELTVTFNFRFSPEFTAEALQVEVEKLLDTYQLDYEIEWGGDADPFLTQRGVLSDIVSAAIKEVTGLEPEFSTTGGTSDARYIAPTGAQVIEFGTLSKMCHQVDEHVSVDDLERLGEIYRAILERFLTELNK